MRLTNCTNIIGQLTAILPNFLRSRQVLVLVYKKNVCKYIKCDFCVGVNSPHPNFIFRHFVFATGFRFAYILQHHARAQCTYNYNYVFWCTRKGARVRLFCRKSGGGKAKWKGGDEMEGTDRGFIAAHCMCDKLDKLFRSSVLVCALAFCVFSVALSFSLSLTYSHSSHTYIYIVYTQYITKQPLPLSRWFVRLWYAVAASPGPSLSLTHKPAPAFNFISHTMHALRVRGVNLPKNTAVSMRSTHHKPSPAPAPHRTTPTRPDEVIYYPNATKHKIASDSSTKKTRTRGAQTRHKRRTNATWLLASCFSRWGGGAPGVVGTWRLDWIGVWGWHGSTNPLQHAVSLFLAYYEAYGTPTERQSTAMRLQN